MKTEDEYTVLVVTNNRNSSGRNWASVIQKHIKNESMTVNGDLKRITLPKINIIFSPSKPEHFQGYSPDILFVDYDDSFTSEVMDECRKRVLSKDGYVVLI